jgi:hypothetical protein
MLAATALTATACLEPPKSNIATSRSSQSTGDTATVVVPAGAKAARVIFKTGKSFDAAAATGTPTTPGSGHRAARVYAPGDDSTPIAMPPWLTSVEVGVSGSANPSAPQPDCARFATPTEASSAVCDYDANAATPGVSCGANDGYLRVSEYDCVRGGSAPQPGNGGGDDGIYIRATFSRDPAKLGASENLMAVLEYTASSLNAGPANPGGCMQGGVFDASAPGCADMVWNTYLKNTSGDVFQPFLMLVPPALGTVDRAANRGGGGVSTRQIVLPLAGNPSLTQLQISRVRGPAANATVGAGGPSIATVCNGAQNPSNSALCAGMIFYSLTIYRI